ncbi:MAG: nicotinate-nucleotide adenylyltransferase [Alphaproteobacteria bacterium]
MGVRRIGLQGGSFDPVHFGHLRAAEEVRERAALDEVWLLLARVSPFKVRSGTSPAEDRLRMLELALDGSPALRPCTVELEREGPSFTVDTVAELARRHPDASFTLILGLDAFRDIHGWHRWDELLSSCDLAVTSRPPERVVPGRDALASAALPIAVQEAFWYDDVQACHRHRSGRRLDFHPLTALDISSTTIRRLVREGRSIRFLTERAVVDWIATRGLYRG